MNKKRIMSILLCATLVLGNSMTAFAKGENLLRSSNPQSLIQPRDVKTKVSQEKAKSIASEFLKKNFNMEITKEFKCIGELDQSLENTETKSYWRLYFRLDSYKGNVNVVACINSETGEVGAIRVEQQADFNTRVPKITFDESRKIAEEFLTSINKDKFNQCVLDTNSNKSSYGTSYNIKFSRKVNEVKFRENGFNVNVDGITGKVTSYGIEWDDNLKFPSIDKVLSNEKINDIYKKDFDASLQYKKFGNKYEYENTKKEKDVKLVYDVNFKNGMDIDAETGKKPQYNVGVDNPTESKDLDKKQKEKFYSNWKELKVEKEPISKEKATEIMQAYVNKFYGKDFKIGNIYFRDNENDNEKYWTADFSKKELKNNKINQEVNISLNALTSQIISLSKYEFEGKYDEKFKPVLTWAQGYDKAIDVLGNMFSDKIKNLNLVQNHTAFIMPREEYVQREYYYSFTRLQNGIPYDNNRIDITVDAKTGTISRVSCNWEYDIEFKKPEGSITKEALSEKFFKDYKPELLYRMVDTSKDEKKPKMEIKPIYILSSSKFDSDLYSIDAFTGRIYNYIGEEINENIDEFKTEITKSKYKKELEILAYEGLLDTKDFKLNKEISKMDLIKNLVDAIGYRPYVVMDEKASKNYSLDGATKENSNKTENSRLSKEDYIKMAKYYGILDENINDTNIESKVTREDMSKVLIKFLKYDKIAEFKGIYNLTFADKDMISKDKLGYVALAQGFEMINIENNKFRPQDNATMEELGLALYKVLQNMQQDRGMIMY